MLSDKIRVLNFDDSLVNQANLIECYRPAVIDLKEIGFRCRHWMDETTAAQIRGVLDPGSKNSVTFLGSGDFHHISSLLIDQFKDDLTVIVFDHHPDWDILPPKLGCGSWVTRILGKPNILKVILFGVSSDDISTFSIQSANIRALKAERLEIYPYFHRPTKVLFRNVPQNSSIQLRKGIFYHEIIWRQIKGNKVGDFFPRIINRIAAKKVYVSIDKDCLRSEYSLTNWEEGNLGLDELLRVLSLIKEKLDICGLDITGDYSRPKTQSRIKAIFSGLDHPKHYTAKDKPQALINSVNEQTNIKIIESLKG